MRGRGGGKCEVFRGGRDMQEELQDAVWGNGDRGRCGCEWRC